LRTIDAHRDSISCIAFSPDASHILTAGRDGLVREFGLRTARMLKEFRGHEAFVNHASYQMRADQLLVVTAGGDGTVRVWDSKSLDVIRILRPVSIGRTLSEAGSSIAIDAQQTGADGAGSAAVHTVLHLHSPPLTMVVVPRGYRAFLVNYLGEVLRIYQDAGAVGDKVFVAATISPSNRSLYCVREDGVCCVFNVTNSELVGTIPNFGAETTRMPKGSSAAAEVSAMVCHPTKPMIAAYSNDGSQSRGQLVLWK
jgi:WD40 repeat-containing protein SMU1